MDLPNGYAGSGAAAPGLLLPLSLLQETNSQYGYSIFYDNPKYKKIIRCKKATKVEIEAPKTLTICIDGETIHRNKVTIEVLKHKIRFVLPKK